MGTVELVGKSCIIVLCVIVVAQAFYKRYKS